MAKILDDVKNAAKWISDALQSSGYKADFSAKSLGEIDRFFDEHASNGEPIPEGLLSEDLGMRIFAIGSYVGEVLRRSLGGKWVGNDADPRAEINVELQLANGVRCWPVQRVMKRYKAGSSEGIAVYATAVGVDIPRS